MRNVILALGLLVVTPVVAQSPSGNIAKDCAIELRRYCQSHLNPSSHQDCLETQVKEIGELCRASMERNGFKRK